MSELSRPRARGIDRVVDVFEHLRAVRHPIGIGELARAIRAPRSTIYEIVERLTDGGLLELDEQNRVYFGPSVYFYADAYLASHPLFRHGRDEAIRLSKVTGETAQICMLLGNKYTVAFMEPGSRLFRIISEIGVLVPIPWTASGRLLLAGMSDDSIRALIPPEDYVLPDKRVIDVEDFLADVAAARLTNRTMTVGLSDPYTACLAAAILDGEQRAVATICFMVPAATPLERREQLLDELVAAARNVSNRLSNQPWAVAAR
jgi:DNA-binding IclR family transcriptional regulator